MNYDIEKLVDKVVKEIAPEKVLSTASEKRMTLAIARQIVEKVKQKALEIGVKAVVAVADIGGNTITVDCMDDAYIASYDIAVNKAFTSVSLKMSTYELSRLARPDGPLYGIQNTNNGRIVIFGGGEPLILNNSVLGGLGVSGGSAEEDTFLGQYGREVFEQLCK